MARGKGATAPSSQSSEFRCPVCQTLVHITAEFEPNKEYGDCIGVTVYCPKCKDRRVDTIDAAIYNFQELINKIGT